MADKTAPSTGRDRSTPFTAAEALCLLEEYNAEQGLLLSAFSDVKNHKSWETIAKKQ